MQCNYLFNFPLNIYSSNQSYVICVIVNPHKSHPPVLVSRCLIPLQHFPTLPPHTQTLTHNSHIRYLHSNQMRKRFDSDQQLKFASLELGNELDPFHSVVVVVVVVRCDITCIKTHMMMCAART